MINLLGNPIQPSQIDTTQNVPEQEAVSFVDAACQTMCAIAQDNLERLEMDRIGRGIFYPSEYIGKLAQFAVTSELLSETSKEKLQDLQDAQVISLLYYSPGAFERVVENDTLLGYQIKEGVTPSEALIELTQGPSLIDCTATCQLAQYWALFDCFGEEKFNCLFATSGDFRLRFGAQYPGNPIQYFRESLMVKNPSPGDFQKGDQVFIQGPINYESRHPIGAASGINVICIEEDPYEPKFCGLGLRPEGMTLAQIDELLLDEYNKEPIQNSEFKDLILSKGQLAHTKRKEQERQLSIMVCTQSKRRPPAKLYNQPINSGQYSQLGGGKVTLVSRPNLGRIGELCQLGQEEAYRAMQGYEAIRSQR